MLYAVLCQRHFARYRVASVVQQCVRNFVFATRIVPMLDVDFHCRAVGCSVSRPGLTRNIVGAIGLATLGVRLPLSYSVSSRTLNLYFSASPVSVGKRGVGLPRSGFMASAVLSSLYSEFHTGVGRSASVCQYRVLWLPESGRCFIWHFVSASGRYASWRSASVCQDRFLIVSEPHCRFIQNFVSASGRQASRRPASVCEDRVLWHPEACRRSNRNFKPASE
jgi:hypothetical protein